MVCFVFLDALCMYALCVKVLFNSQRAIPEKTEKHTAVLTDILQNESNEINQVN